MEISPDKQNIDGVFSRTTYHIDFYQRDYKWTSEPVLRLLGDVFFKFNQEYEKHISLEPSRETVLEKYSWYYLNTYVTNTAKGKVYVVDGQQRLTTLTILLIKLSSKAKELECEKEFIDWINSKIMGFSGGRRAFWMNHEKSLDVLGALFEGKKDICTTSITSKNLFANYNTISDFIDNKLKDEHCFKNFCLLFLISYSPN